MENNNLKSAQNLLDINFIKVGRWMLSEAGDLELIKEIENSFAINNALYAFVMDGKEDDIIKYIGKTTQTLNKRFLGYAKPGKGQQTNLRVNEKIVKELERGNKISIYFFRDIEPLKWGIYNLNLASGLEDSLVYNISPEWNKAGKKVLTSSEEMEVKVLQRNSDTSLNYEFQIVLGKAYFYQGYMNPGSKISEFLGKAGETVKLIIDNKSISANIDRTSNPNGAVRLYFGKKLAKWYQENFKIGDCINAILTMKKKEATISIIKKSS